MKRLTKCIIVLSSCICLLLPKKIARGCGFGVYSGEYRFWILQPDLAGIVDLSRLYLSSDYFYNEDAKVIPAQERLVNIEEWYKQIKKAATKEAIEEMLYDMPPSHFLTRFDSLKRDNSFIRVLAQPRNKELLQYFILSKKTESIATDPDPWQEHPATNKKIAEIIQEADQLYLKANTDFVRLRSSYQAMRLHKYNNNRPAAAAVYNKRIVKNKLSSMIQGAALYEMAGCVPEPGKSYLYARTFDMGYRRESCVERFASEKVNEILRYARNDQERTVIHALHALNYKGRSLKNIKTIYNQHPGYPELDFLLLREINKAEDWLMTPKLTEYPPALHDNWSTAPKFNYNQDLEYTKELYRFIVDKLCPNPALDKPDLKWLMAAHLAFVLGDYKSAEEHLMQVEIMVHHSPPIDLQLSINKLLLYTVTHKPFDTTAQQMLLGILQTPNEKLPVHSPGIMKDQLALFIAKKLMQRGEFVKGVMLLARTNRAYGDKIPASSYKHIYHELEEGGRAADYDAILAIMDKKNKTPFEEYVATSPVSAPTAYYDYDRQSKAYAWDRNCVLDLKASYYLRHDSLQQALFTLEQIPGSFWASYPYVDSDPFTSNIFNGHRNDRYEPICNKLDAVKEMIRLQELAKKDPKQAALCYLLLGNAHYNLTWHGKNWVNVKQWWSSTEFYYDIERTAFNDTYFGCTRARDYYLKAMKSAGDKKIASLSCFLAGKCNNNYRQYIHYTSKNNGDIKKTNPYVSLLKKEGFKTDFYDQLVLECHTYESFRLEVRRMLP